MKQFLSFLLFTVLFTNGFALDSIIFFEENPTSNDYYDTSWGTVTDPSQLELAGTTNNKFPVDSEHSYQGSHSLRLKWNSSNGGDWGMAVASYGWTAHNFTQYDSIVYYINGPEAVAKANLPDLAIEDISNTKSTRVWLGDYLNGVDSDSTNWQKVLIPIEDFKPGQDNCNFSNIKTIFHFQKETDSTDHIVWLDNIHVIGSGEIPLFTDVPKNLTATGHDSRIDLKWDLNKEKDYEYNIYRSSDISGPFTRINNAPHITQIYSDFLGQNNQTYYYYVTNINTNLLESSPSDTVSATSYQMSDEELLTSVQEATFRYFYDHGHPESGLSRERNSGPVGAIGATGFGLMAMPIGVERGFVSRDSAAARVLKILRFVQDVTPRYHGAWSHWVSGASGNTVPFSRYDNGGDLVETSYLIMGVLTIRKYFTQNNAVENEIRTRATELWESVEWDWYRQDPPKNVLYWHWSPDHGWKMNHAIRGFHEAMIVYLLAIASPTYPVPASLYYDGWTSRSNYANGNKYYGYKIWVGPPYGGPLFFTHYTNLGFDPRNKADKYCNYFENNRNISLIHRAYSIANPLNYAGYDSLVWGLTASYSTTGYSAHRPMTNDNGTITPSAALSAMPYTPKESLATLKHFYHTYGDRLWGEFGFRDAFNLQENWFSQGYLGIDQGPIIIMIENSRSELCWDLFMANDEIQQMLDKIGWTTSVDDENNYVVNTFDLSQNYPNPFNSGTLIRFELPKSTSVTLEIYNINGRLVTTIVKDKVFESGNHTLSFYGENLSSGIYFYKLSTKDYQRSKKMILIR
jgi:hypothetical protein